MVRWLGKICIYRSLEFGLEKMFQIFYNLVGNTPNDVKWMPGVEIMQYTLRVQHALEIRVIQACIDTVHLTLSASVR